MGSQVPGCERSWPCSLQLVLAFVEIVIECALFAGLLGLIHQRIGGLDDGLGILWGVVIGDDANAERDRRVQAAQFLRDLAFDLFQHRAGPGLVCVGEEQAEFIAAQAGEQVGFADQPGDGLRDQRQLPVSGFMPQVIIDHFEIIEVDIDHADRVLQPTGALEFQSELLDELAFVVNAGQVIGAGCVLFRAEGGLQVAEYMGEHQKGGQPYGGIEKTDPFAGVAFTCQPIGNHPKQQAGDRQDLCVFQG